ncbi:MAG TPA: hypothetical protein VMA31_11500 [Bryobacteraceae bacterium]|nr:hypothetical protein [Bryobacteraceae bacterium]
MHVFRDLIFLVLFFVFLVAWLVVWAAFHLAGGGVHLLIVLAVFFLIVHFVRHRRAV